MKLYSTKRRTLSKRKRAMKKGRGASTTSAVTTGTRAGGRRIRTRSPKKRTMSSLGRKRSPKPSSLKMTKSRKLMKRRGVRKMEIGPKKHRSSSSIGIQSVGSSRSNISQQSSKDSVEKRVKKTPNKSRTTNVKRRMSKPRKYRQRLPEQQQQSLRKISQRISTLGRNYRQRLDEITKSIILKLFPKTIDAAEMSNESLTSASLKMSHKSQDERIHHKSSTQQQLKPKSSNLNELRKSSASSSSKPPPPSTPKTAKAVKMKSNRRPKSHSKSSSSKKKTADDRIKSTSISKDNINPSLSGKISTTIKSSKQSSN
ncbi:hypothetical protein BLA29_003056 [Euroglyphus maynei]|uniref:Uncharacterized protein n=1 Tax=Euroglyphus maynei TaxID=6958 RepID=A0A1Y3BEF1_EURMA|nr:hypothetical protein BLA29_003056 [Euroglyphus maynei]